MIRWSPRKNQMVLFTVDPLFTKEKSYGFVYRWSVDHLRKNIWFFSRNLPLIRWSVLRFFRKVYRWSVDQLSGFFREIYRWSVDQIYVFFAKVPVCRWSLLQFYFQSYYCTVHYIQYIFWWSVVYFNGSFDKWTIDHPYGFVYRWSVDHLSNEYGFVYRWSVDHPRKIIWFCLPLIRWSDLAFFREIYRWSIDQYYGFFRGTFRWSVDQIRCFQFRKTYHNWNPALFSRTGCSTGQVPRSRWSGN